MPDGGVFTPASIRWRRHAQPSGPLSDEMSAANFNHSIATARNSSRDFSDSVLLARSSATRACSLQ